jgi:serine/threonine protein kinase
MISVLGVTYTIKKRLGEGGTGWVDEAVNTNSNKIYAIKTVLSQNKDKATKAMKEIEILKSVNSHNNVVKIFASQKKHDIHIVMEHCNGGSLRSDRQYSEQDVQRFLPGIAKAIQYIHYKNVVHGDLQPQNILLHNGCVKLSDFGDSQVLNKGQKLSYGWMGYALYMAPETLKKEPYDTSIDIWQVGILIYQLLTMAKPFRININTGSRWEHTQDKRIVLHNIIDYFAKEVKLKIPTNIKVSTAMRTLVSDLVRYNASSRLSDEDFLRRVNQYVHNTSDAHNERRNNHNPVCTGQKRIKTCFGTYLTSKNHKDVTSTKGNSTLQHWYVEDHNEKVVLKAYHSPGRFLSASSNSTVVLVDKIGANEKWKPIPTSGGTLLLQSRHNTYLTTNENGGFHLCSRRGTTQAFSFVRWN